jgi:hypothetical protein
MTLFRWRIMEIYSLEMTLLYLEKTTIISEPTFCHEVYHIYIYIVLNPNHFCGNKFVLVDVTIELP